MNYYNLVDSAAVIAKIGIEHSHLTRDEKECDKQWVDFCKELLKGFISSHEAKQTVLGLDLSRVAFIEKTAHESGIKRVVLIPVPGSIGIGSLLIKCYGNDADCFFKKSGIQPISTKLSRQDSDLIKECEKNSGITIYDRDQLREAPL